MPTTIADVRKSISSLPSMAALKPEDYAEKGGYADIVVSSGTKLNATQLRKIFHHIKDLNRKFQRPGGTFERSKVALLMPALAYAKGRNHLPEDFYELLILCFGQAKCNTAEDFDNASNFLEAIMAYHKYYNS